ncbi:TPA: DUF1015 domain-containing protein [Thermoplasmata archaeon]|nr:DUF1015 domain-containing protein [Thermoplasmata archaeon]
MARIAPFRAVHYNNLRFGNEVLRLVAPPYDVIDRSRERKLKEDRLNITYITLGNEDDSYATAAKRLRRWLNDEVMLTDRTECLYLYEQTFQGIDGKVRMRTGMVAAVHLEEFSKGVILPHENTIPGHKADRRELMEAIGGNTEQIFMLYDDSTGEVEATIDECRKAEEALRFIDEDGVHHRIIRVDDEAVIGRMRELLEPQTMLIADGHHRYETALEYRAGRGPSKNGHDRPFDYVLATLVSFRNPGLVINPTHRLVAEVDKDVAGDLKRLLSKEFRLTDFGSHEELLKNLEEGPSGAFGVWCPSADLRAVAVPKDRHVPEGPLEGLSVYVLQEKVLKGLLGFTTEMLDKKTNIDYVKDPGAAISKVETGEHAACFFVKPPTVAQVMEVAKAGLKMPHKSTYFSPKIWSGALLYLFGEQ